MNSGEGVEGVVYCERMLWKGYHEGEDHVSRYNGAVRGVMKGRL